MGEWREAWVSLAGSLALPQAGHAFFGASSLQLGFGFPSEQWTHVSGLSKAEVLWCLWEICM